MFDEKTVKYPISENQNEYLYSRGDILGAFAMWAVRQSPYTQPDNLEEAVDELNSLLSVVLEFDRHGFTKTNYFGLIEVLKRCFKKSKEISKFNIPKRGYTESRYSSNTRPDYDFIDLDALARNTAHTLTMERVIDE